MQTVSKTVVFRRFGHAHTAAAVMLSLVGVTHLLYHASYTLDDAYISFRYARNLARGGGLVYNPGEYVKGYSNTLYTLLMAVPEWFRCDPLFVAKAIGLTSFCVLCWLGYDLHAREGTPEARDRGLGLVAFFALSTSLAVHYIGGLETGLHTTLAFAAVTARVREQRDSDRPWSALLFAAVVLGRPEGVLLFAVMATHDIVFRALSRRFQLRDLAWYLIPTVVYVGELALSTLYYGDALPQTYYAKTRAAHGIVDALRVMTRQWEKQLGGGSYLLHGLDGIGLGHAGIALLLLALLCRGRQRQNLAFVLALLAQLVFVIRAGSDWAPGFRFGVPALPFLFALLIDAIAASAALARRHRRLAGLAVLTIAIGVAMPRNISDSQEIQRRKYVNAAALLREGTWLAALAEPGGTLSSFDIGGEGYAAGGFDILDTAGLVVRQTTRCRNTPRCARYASLVRPELVRRHPGTDKDAFVAEAVRKDEPYLELSSGKYLIRRSLVLLDRLPEWALPQTPPCGPPASQIVARDLPVVLRAGQETGATFYWKRDGTAALVLLDRRLAWRNANGTSPAHESAVLWKSVGDTSAWKQEVVFADHVVLRAPLAAGRYELTVKIDQGDEQAVAGVDVVGMSEAGRRSKLLSREAQRRLQSNDELSTIRLLGRAVQLDSNAETRRAYHRLAVTRTQRLRKQAELMMASDHVAALRLLQEAKVILHRAYWESGLMTSELRSEIDTNAALRTQIVERDLSAQPRRASPRRRVRRN